MGGKNPFAKFGSPAPSVEVEDAAEPGPVDENFERVAKRVYQSAQHAVKHLKPDTKARFISGLEYHQLLTEWRDGGHKPEALIEQDLIDDERFENLEGDDWKELDDEEERMRASRSIARREDDGYDDFRAIQRAGLYEEARQKEHKRDTIGAGMFLWTMVGVGFGCAHGGVLGGIGSGVAFFFMYSLVLFVIATVTGMSDHGGRAV